MIYVRMSDNTHIEPGLGRRRSVGPLTDSEADDDEVETFGVGRRAA